MPGLVDGRPAAVVCDPADPAAPPVYFILLDWTADGSLATIRDFRYALEGAAVVTDPSAR